MLTRRTRFPFIGGPGVGCKEQRPCIPVGCLGETAFVTQRLIVKPARRPQMNKPLFDVHPGWFLPFRGCYSSLVGFTVGVSFTMLDKYFLLMFPVLHMFFFSWPLLSQAEGLGGFH